MSVYCSILGDGLFDEHKTCIDVAYGDRVRVGVWPDSQWSPSVYLTAAQARAVAAALIRCAEYEESFAEGAL